jgi:hypothetical protein
MARDANRLETAPDRQGGPGTHLEPGYEPNERDN